MGPFVSSSPRLGFAQSSSSGRQPSTRSPGGAFSKSVFPRNRGGRAPVSQACGPCCSRTWPPRPRGKEPQGFVSTLFQNMYSWPLPEVHVVLQAIVQVWHAMHLLMSNTALTCFVGRDSAYSYFIDRSSCQLNTSAISTAPVVPVEVGLHRRALVLRPEALRGGAPQAHPADAAVLGPGDPDEGLLGGGGRAGGGKRG